MHYAQYSHKIENEICLLPSQRQCYFCNVTFVYHKFNKKKKSLRAAFLLFVMILFLSKRQSGNHVMLSTITSGKTVVLKIIDANLESTGHFEQQKNPLACRSLSVYLYFLMKTRLTLVYLYTNLQYN